MNMFNTTSTKIFTTLIILVLCVMPGLQAGNSPFETLRGQKLILSSSTVSAQSVLMKEMALDRVQKRTNHVDKSCLHIQGLQQKKTLSATERILNWDFKIKVRLNKNLNIIFSYN